MPSNTTFDTYATCYDERKISLDTLAVIAISSRCADEYAALMKRRDKISRAEPIADYKASCRNGLREVFRHYIWLLTYRPPHHASNHIAALLS